MVTPHSRFSHQFSQYFTSSSSVVIMCPLTLRFQSRSVLGMVILAQVFKIDVGNLYESSIKSKKKGIYERGRTGLTQNSTKT